VRNGDVVLTGVLDDDVVVVQRQVG
jgi:hypothetical protein